MKSDTRIFIGDLVRAISFLGLEARDDVGKLIGFEWVGAAEVALPRLQHTIERPPVVQEQEPPPVREQEERPAEAGLLPFRMESSTYSPGRPIPAPLPIERPTAKILKLAPLFQPHWERSLLAESIYTQREEGDVDVVRAAESIAKGQPLVRPPREWVRTTSRGCQLLIDTGIGMRPYAHDTELFIRSMTRVAGIERVHTFRFVDSPLNGVQTEDGENLLTVSRMKLSFSP